MKFCLSWLEEWLGERLEAEPLAEELTMAGLEVDRLSPVAAVISGVVVGRIRRVEPHAGADRLKLCEVDAGSGRSLQVVCGAPDVREEMRVPFASVGARVGDLEISEAEICGVSSRGMLCSASDLGIEEESSGLLDLGDGVAAGTDLVEYLKLDDTVFELDLTPNRADCFSMLGLAREVAAIHGNNLDTTRNDTVAPTHEHTFEVLVSEPTACPRYLTRVVKNISTDVRTPLWMKERLRRSGIRALYPAVDVMNYVMLELGQPLHAFDLDRIEAPLEVRFARGGETTELIGGAHAKLNQDTLLIADTRGPLALAGIIGGAASAVSEATRDILIECAFFAPEAVVGRARSYGLHTDSSLRFERGVDPTLQRRAMERACQLLAEISDGEFGPVSEIATPEKPIPLITLHRDALCRLLGIEIGSDEVSRMLGFLGCSVQRRKGGWHCTPPPHRFDLVIEEDLIEEIARLHGYNKIAAGPGGQIGTARGDTTVQVPLETPRDRNHRWCVGLADRGYSEVITYSFVDPDLLAAVSEAPALALRNPVSPGMSVMRTSLWPGLLNTVVHNLRRQRERVRVFELGRCFGERGERLVLAGLASGDLSLEQWGVPSRACDFYDVKGDLQSLLGTLEISYRRSSQQGLHPGRAADILLEDARIGCFGALAPAVAQQLGIVHDTFLFELEMDGLALYGPVQATPVSRYPSVRRDISVTVPDDVSAEQILDCVRGLGVDFLHEVVLFDVYQDQRMKKGTKAIALGLIFQDFSDTLSDEVCTGIVEEVVDALADSLNVELRG